jgi:predicted nucleic acid-binding protein
MIYCDTSTIAKLYVAERESAAVRGRLEAEDEVCACELARPELMGAFHRRLREGKWTRSEFLAVVRQFSADDIGGFWTWLPLEREIIEAAAQTYTTLPENVFLRTSDCLHLITALHHNFAEFYTHDRHQMDASAALGIRPLAIQAEPTPS